MEYTWYEMGWIVLIYSCLGWCAEVAYAAVKTGRFVNRGFLNGPVCPIYGFGMLIVLLVLEPVKENLALLFFGSMVFTSLLEFLVGFALERIFHDKWWDYTDCPFNLMGYVCLEFSLIWGVACVLAVDVIHPQILDGIRRLPLPAGKWLELALGAVMLADAAITLYELLKLPRRFKAIDELEKGLTAVSDTMGEKLIYEPMERGKHRREAFEESHPELAERTREAARDLMAKRAEINQNVKAKEDEARAAMAARRAEREAKLHALLESSFVHRRIAAAYPALLKGEHHGAHFRRLKEYYEERKNGKSA